MPSGDAFGKSAKARIGMYNDCFLASKNDVGTLVALIRLLALQKVQRLLQPPSSNSPKNKPPKAKKKSLKRNAAAT